jgi:gluconate 5-dehydrogenase
MQNLDPTVWELFDLTGEVIIVTGAPGQLGTQMSFALAEAGANVVVTSRTLSDCEILASRLDQEYNESLPFAADVTNESDVIDLVDATLRNFGKIDGLVNNAYSAKGYGKNLQDLSVSEWKSAMDGILTQTFICVKSVQPHLAESPNGTITNIASHYGLVSPDQRIYADTDMNNPPNYGAAKAGLMQFTRWLSTYLANDNIRVNNIVPGGFYNEELAQRKGYTEEFLPNYEHRTPLGRMGDSTDLKGAVVFLNSMASKWMTGQDLIIDGGWTAW